MHCRICGGGSRNSASGTLTNSADSYGPAFPGLIVCVRGARLERLSTTRSAHSHSQMSLMSPVLGYGPGAPADMGDAARVRLVGAWRPRGEHNAI